MKIDEIDDDSVVNIASDTIGRKKQALVFCNTRRSAEATAEKISKLIKNTDNVHLKISEQILKALQSPTKQCRRLSLCVKKGIAFHHAGLSSKQREIIEENFKSGNIHIICSTPTLAMGINLPAFRTIIKDLKRYGGRWGMQWIPTLEYHQMAGRAGRPDFNDEFGEAICIASTEKDIDEIVERFIRAPPEKIYSKLAVEPVLRTYCLSLIATGFARSKKELVDFFEKTFYGHQYGDMQRLQEIIEKILGLLEEWEFIRGNNISREEDDFVSADYLAKKDEEDSLLEATRLGERVAQLYLDPYTAHYIIISLRRATQKITDEFSFLTMTASTLELRPLPTVRVKEVESVESELAEHSSSLIIFEPSVFDPDYDEFLKSIKLSLCLKDWMDEHNEEELLEKYNIAPGELHLKRNLCDWILYASEEIAALMNYREQISMIRKTRFRLDKGIKEELIPLSRLKNIGRVRARLLFRNNIRNLGDVKKADITKLKQLLGEKTALNLKSQVGEKVEIVPKGKRKGQTGLTKYDQSKTS